MSDYKYHGFLIIIYQYLKREKERKSKYLLAC